MSIILRFVDCFDILRYHFFKIVNVPNTIAATLKEKMSTIFSRYNLYNSTIMGQEYDGVSNMSRPLEWILGSIS